jgi:transcriptional regulator with XRE-family HTH domain
MATNRLKEVLEREGIRQSEIAYKSGVSVGTVNRTCNMKRTPSPTMRHKILKALVELTGTEYHHDDIF